MVPPAVDTPLTPEGRSKQGDFRPSLGPAEFAAGVMRALAADVPEVGYGATEDLIRTSRAELDERFARMTAALQPRRL